MIIKEVTDIIEELAPPDTAEDFDNVGLLVGEANTPLTGVLITLDTLEEVVDEALEKGCNLILSFHPILFAGLKRITGKTYAERAVIKAIRNNIAIYAVHTALDNAWEGVNARILKVLGAGERRVLIPQKGALRKLTTYVPQKEAQKLKDALFKAGAGHIGKYSHCSFSVDGTGSFRAGADADPFVGEVGKTHYEAESQLNLVFPGHLEARIIQALKKHHPYEEVAYEVTVLQNAFEQMGMGMTGVLDKPMAEKDFLKYVKDKMKVAVIRHSALTGKKISKIAVLGGSGAFAIRQAIGSGADAFITSDIKYHQFYESEGKLLLMDIGHFESEQFTKSLLLDYLTKKIPNFAISLSEVITNPIKYYY